MMTDPKLTLPPLPNLPTLSITSTEDVIHFAERFGPGLLALIASYYLLRLTRNLVAKTLRGDHKGSGIGDLHSWRFWIIPMIERIYWVFLFSIALKFSLHLMPVDKELHKTTSLILSLSLFLQMGLWATTLLKLKTHHILNVAEGRDGARVTMLTTLTTIGQIGIWVIVLLLIFENLGVNISALVAGLGIGGVAVAFAFKSVLEDVFASLSIAFDRPFVIGDFIISGEHMGTVEQIGLKNVRIRSLSGEQIIINNNDILASRIRNYGRMYERRVLFSLGVEYGTPIETLKRIPSLIRAAIESHPNTRFDRSHFKDYGESSLNFETVYFMTEPDFNTMMDTQQAVNLAIYEAFEREHINFAFPTQTIYLNKSGEG